MSTRKKVETAMVSHLIGLHGPEVIRDQYPSYTQAPGRMLFPECRLRISGAISPQATEVS
jgi:hypothetical protein